MRECTSKYHEGDNLLDDSLFIGSANRCAACARRTNATYKRSAKGRSTKQAHYERSAGAYKQTMKKSRAKMIAVDQGVSYLFVTAQRRAKRCGLAFTITVADAQVPRVCPVYGIPLEFSSKRTPNTPSLDRIDNSLGYVPGNVCVISWHANYKKRDLSVSDIDKIYAYMTGTIYDRT